MNACLPVHIGFCIEPNDSKLYLMPEPVAYCQCRYPLLEGQDCPECGRAFELAIRTGPPQHATMKTICGILTLLSLILVAGPVLALYLVVKSNFGEILAAIAVFFLGVFCWLTAVPLAMGSAVASAYLLKKYGSSGLLCLCLIVDVIVLIPPVWLLIATS